MSRLIFDVASLMALAMVCQTANADLVLLELSGEAGSNVISYTASGSFTSNVANVNANSSDNAQLPSPNSWSQFFDNELGDVFIDNSFLSTRNDDRPLSAAVSIFVNGVQFGLFDTIDLDRDESNGDDVELDPTATINYPQLSAGDIITFGSADGSGVSGTFTLDEGTFDTIFNLGTFNNEDETYQVIVSSTAVPEPSSLLFLLGASAATLCIRRRS